MDSLPPLFLKLPDIKPLAARRHTLRSVHRLRVVQIRQTLIEHVDLIADIGHGFEQRRGRLAERSQALIAPHKELADSRHTANRQHVNQVVLGVAIALSAEEVLRNRLALQI